MIETVKFCPLDKECKTIKDNKIYQCEWLTQIAGTHPQTGEATNEEKCTVAWLPVLLIGLIKGQAGNQQAVEIMADAVTKRQDKLLTGVAISQQVIDNQALLGAVI